MQLQRGRLATLNGFAGRARLRATIVFAGMVALLLQSAGVLAQARCAQPAARAASVEGRVELRVSAEAAWQPVRPDDPLCAGDTVRVLERSRAGLLLKNDVLLRLDQNSVLSLGAAEPEEPSVMELLRGWLHVITRHRKRFSVTTPVANAVVEGTEFTVSAELDQSSVTVDEGRVQMQSPGGALALESGQAGVVRGPGAPQPFPRARPLDAVQWALYFPPVLRHRPSLSDPALATLEQQAAALALAGDATGALERIAQIPPDARSPSVRTFEASLLLSVGRVDEASAILKHLSGAGRGSSNTLALTALVELIAGDKETAAANAQSALRVEPGATALLVQSFVYQAQYRLEQALASARQAAAKESDNPLAAARVAELQLALGDIAGAHAGAQRVVEMAPQFGRGHTLLGFVLLAEGRTQRAQTAFEAAIQLSQADPLPRLGRGLARIRQGALEEGRRELELAVLLDPGNSLLRSYLGKAYYDEKRERLAGTELDLARSLDPKDPTPWFYDAIRKQNSNRTGEAIEDLQRSRDLNENRAVYRSRLLLDQDQAARSASLARIYSEAGFDQLSLSEGQGAVSQDPANFSAHRFLADAYTPVPRYESARVSELLQSQLLQPANAVPVPPRLGQTRAPIVEGEGPLTPSFQEFNPLFSRDHHALFLSGVVGENSTYGDEAMYALVSGNQALRFGQFHYQTDGWRTNNDFKQDIYSAFYQNDLAWHTSVQAEYRVSRIDNGDIRSHIDPNNFSTALRQSNDQDIARIGLRHATSADAIWLASWTYTRVDSQFTDSALQDLGFGTLQSDTRSDTSISGYTAELQHLRRIGPAALTAGAGGTELSAHNSFSLDQFIVGFPPFGPPIVSIGDSSQRYQTGYAYVGWDVARGVKLITALSYDNFLDTSVFQTHQWNPKLGLVWAMSERTTLRAAGLRTLKRPFAANQTLEPTQVAGFNQLFDDVDGTDARRYGIGLDYRAADRWFAGVELSTRDLDVPVAAAGGGLARFEPRREQLYRVYLSALPTRQLALSAEYRYEDEERRTPVGYSDSFPQRVTSHLLPVRATYFHPSGLLGRVQVTAVHQRVDAFNGPGTTVGQQSDFALLDLSLGYRLPGRHGLISLEVRNLFDRRFGFEDTDFAGNPRVPLFQPGRTVMLRFALYP